jgi:thioredoxin 1
VDDNPAITMRYMVRGIPTVMLFKDGQIVDQLVGSPTSPS